MPYDELPAWRNPPDGTIVTANNRIVPDDYPHLISTEWLNPYRAERIADLLARRDRHTPADLAGIQTDIYSLPLARLRDLVRDQEATDAIERRALGLLESWDGEMAVESAGAAIAATLLRQLTLEAYAETGRELERFLGAEGFSLLSPLLEFFGRTVPGMLDALELRDDGFFRDGRTWRGVIGKCLTRTCVELERRLGPDPEAWTWGEIHVLSLDHPLAALPGFERIFRRGPHPLPGEADTVWAAAHPITDPVTRHEDERAGTAVRREPRRPGRDADRALRRPVRPPRQPAVRRPGRRLAGGPDAAPELVARRSSATAPPRSAGPRSASSPEFVCHLGRCGAAQTRRGTRRTPDSSH